MITVEQPKASFKTHLNLNSYDTVQYIYAYQKLKSCNIQPWDFETMIHMLFILKCYDFYHNWLKIIVIVLSTTIFHFHSTSSYFRYRWWSCSDVDNCHIVSIRKERWNFCNSSNRKEPRRIETCVKSKVIGHSV